MLAYRIPAKEPTVEEKVSCPKDQRTHQAWTWAEMLYVWKLQCTTVLLYSILSTVFPCTVGLVAIAPCCLGEGFKKRRLPWRDNGPEACWEGVCTTLQSPLERRWILYLWKRACQIRKRLSQSYWRLDQFQCAQKPRLMLIYCTVPYIVPCWLFLGASESRVWWAGAHLTLSALLWLSRLYVAFTSKSTRKIPSLLLGPMWRVMWKGRRSFSFNDSMLGLTRFGREQGAASWNQLILQWTSRNWRNMTSKLSKNSDFHNFFKKS